MSNMTKDFDDGEFSAVSIINQLAAVCYERSKEKGFWNDQERVLAVIRSAAELTDAEVKQLLHVVENTFYSQKNELMHSELGEATEAARKDLSSDKLPGFSGEEEEYADTIIRILDLAGRKKMRLGEAVVLKMRYNEGREYMHGKKF